MRGRKPTPTALKVARGNPSKRGLNHDEPQIDSPGTEPPAGLAGAARKEWVRLARVLVEAGVLTIADLAGFATYCRLVGEEDTYQKLITKLGTESSMRLGYPGHLLKIRAQKRQYEAEYGLTPSSRSRVKANKPKDQTDARRRKFFGVINGNSQTPKQG